MSYASSKSSWATSSFLITGWPKIIRFTSWQQKSPGRHIKKTAIMELYSYQSLDVKGRMGTEVKDGIRN